MENYEFLIVLVFLIFFQRLLTALLHALIEHGTFLIITGIPVLVATLIFAMTSMTADVPAQRPLTQQDFKRIQNKLEQTLNGAGNSLKTVQLNQEDLNIISNFLLNKSFQSASEVNLFDKRLMLKTTIALPDNAFNPYINIQFQLLTQQNKPVITQLKLGQLDIPDEFTPLLLDQLIKHSSLNQYYQLGQNQLSEFNISSEFVQLKYATSSTSPNQQPQNKQTQPALKNTTTFYQNKLNVIINNHDKKWLLSLADLLQPLFKEAYQRSQNTDPIAENQAIIVVVNDYVNHQHKIQSMLPTFATLPVTLEHLPVYIYQRTDLAQHFMGSATLTAFGNAQLTHIVGQEKEMYDADQGSGFSFSDLTADRAGVRFGAMATDSEQTARMLQKKMASIESYQAFMPSVKQLPDNMTLKQFTERFVSIDSLAFRDQLKEIDRRIDACSIYSTSDL